MDKNLFLEGLNNLFPNPKCELNYKSTYELLVAVILSAQCTDKRVNIVTSELFKEYNIPQKMLSLSQEKFVHVDFIIIRQKIYYQ